MEKKSLHITDLEVNTDLPGSELPANVFTKAINFRPVDNKLVGTKIAVPAPYYYNYREWVKYTWKPIPTEGINVVAGQRGGINYFLVSGKNSDWIFDGSSWTDVTSSGKVAGSIGSDSNLWTTAKLGFNLVVNHSEFFPEFWSGQFGERLAPVMFSPYKTFQQKGIRCRAIRSHKNFLFALGLNERGVDLPHAYRWSHPADINGMPFSWDEHDLSTLASKESVGGDYGVIVDGLSLRDSFCLYTESSIHVLDYTGDEHVFRRRLLTSSYGCLATNCVVEAQNLHYVMTPHDIVINDGTSVTSLLTNQLKKVYANLSRRYFKASFAVVDAAKAEVWFCFPEGDYKFPSAAIVYNYVTKKIGITRLVATASHYDAGAAGEMSSICFGVQLPVAFPWYSLDSYFSSWSTWQLPVTSSQEFVGIGIDNEQPPSAPDFTDTWSPSSPATLLGGLYGVGPGLQYINKVNSTNESAFVLPENPYPKSDIVTVFEKTNWSLDGQIDVKTLTRVYPSIYATGRYGTAKLFVGAHAYNGSSIRWDEPILFDPINDRKIDVRTTGELLAIRFEFRGYDEVEFYGFDIEYTINGKR